MIRIMSADQAAQLLVGWMQDEELPFGVRTKSRETCWTERD